MNEAAVQDASLKPLLDKMVAAKQLSAIDAKSLARNHSVGSDLIQSEEDVLRWLAENTVSPTRRWRTSSRIASCSRCSPRASC